MCRTRESLQAGSVVAAVLICLFICAGCFSMMGEKDWAKLDRISKQNGWTPAQKEAFKEELIAKDEEMREALAKDSSQLAKTIIDAIPVPVPKEPIKEIAEYAIYGLFGLGAAGVGVKSVKNSPPGKIFGHPFKAPNNTNASVPPVA